ncbi:hypothetical protein MNBD_IGNAVI01-2596 [hydrothermal vent metagenome]|uniref:Uncharacterized protein n=1 Tax=hydrothermal vent metagenome TaxID=652676 RepID=A0A3B1C144_9ZZZZ
MKINLIFEVAGIWLVLMAFFNLPAIIVMFSYLLIGIIVMASGIIIRSGDILKRLIIANIGLWLIISAYIPHLLIKPGSLWNELISGIFLILLGYKTTNVFHKKIISN